MLTKKLFISLPYFVGSLGGIIWLAGLDFFMVVSYFFYGIPKLFTLLLAAFIYTFLILKKINLITITLYGIVKNVR